MPETDLELLMRAAYAAGELATSFVGGALDVTDKPDGAGPVTAADLAVNALLEDLLRNARPDYGWLSEESQDNAARLSTQKVFVVDPIDGTRSFIEGGRTWAHSIAVVDSGQVETGAVYLPMRDKLYIATRGQGAFLNNERLQVAPARGLTGAQVLATRPQMAPQHWRGDVPDIDRKHRPSLAYRLGLVSQGRYDAMMTLRPTWEWDIAAGVLLVQEAGGYASDRNGRQITFNARDPRANGIVAGSNALHTALIRELAPAEFMAKAV